MLSVTIQEDILTLENKSKFDDDTIKMYEKSKKELTLKISELENQNKSDKESYEIEKQAIIKRYEGLITGLEEDIQSWKTRYLKINNTTLDGTIITKYGTVLGN